MKSFKEVILEAEKNGVAVGHFNFAELTVMRAAMEVAGELGVPVILGTSESEREFLGKDILSSIFGRLPSVGRVTFPVFFNADHTKSLEKVKEAVAVGCDSITFDASHLPLEENIKNTKEVVDYVKSVNSDILVEGEIGFIGSGSQLRESIPEGVQLTTSEEAVRFVKETGVDMLAPAVGNVHGIIKGGEPKLNIDLIRKIKEMLREAQHDVPLVLHGASGNSDEDIRSAIKAGISIVHISTEVRLAWRNTLAEFLQKNPSEVAPYKILAPAQEAVKKVIIEKLKLFNKL